MADVVVDAESKNSKELYGQGVRAFILRDFSTAVSALGKASQLLADEHGDDLHESLGEVYLYYGKSLLGLSREESEALGDAVPRNEESSEEDNADETEENDEEGENSTEPQENNENEAKEAEKSDDAKKTDDAKQSDGEKQNGTTVANGSGEGTSNGITKEDGADDTAAETEDEPTDLQVAWEVLELAKKIFQKQGTAAKKNLAETLIVLGEVSLESENFESAVNDITEGLKIQKDIFAKDSRTVAETYYKLGVAYSTNTQIDEAINSFNSSLEYLNNRIAHLESVEDKKDEVDEEIKEIKSLIPDIQEKVTDMKTYKDEAMKNIVSAMTEGIKSDKPAPSTSSSKPATDISHLVKRKRKADEIDDKDAAQESNPSKKVNQ
ncbi:protein HGV2 isoform X2 [Diabrotica virgifera virgifera]|uniref:Protein HGV2 isoform X2 n=1 Tax=Diabrotica virgifera virgifera TaxID=50390 RepID=A0A6P7GMS1_DIAVI|nr:protein HGV2 isoform X2 [Diabrotica virgifera virgifera]